MHRLPIGREKGAVLVEASLVLPLMLLLLAVLWSLDGLLQVYASLNQAVRDASLSAVLVPPTACGAGPHTNLEVDDAGYLTCMTNPAGHATPLQCCHIVVQYRMRRLLESPAGRNIINANVQTSLGVDSNGNTFTTLLTATLDAPACLYNGRTIGVAGSVDVPLS